MKNNCVASVKFHKKHKNCPGIWHSAMDAKFSLADVGCVWVGGATLKLDGLKLQRTRKRFKRQGTWREEHQRERPDREIDKTKRVSKEKHEHRSSLPEGD